MFKAIIKNNKTTETRTLISLINDWLFSGQNRLGFTVLTFITMFAGLFAETWAKNPQFAFYLYVAAYLFGGIYGVHAGITALREFKIDVDILMILAAIGAFIIDAPFEGAMLLFLFSLSNVLQEYALQRTSNAISALMKLRPDSALVRKGSKLVNIPIGEIKVGDRIIVRPGERIPLDGLVLSGESTVDQSSLTGEPIPVEKYAGSQLFAGTINLHGGLEMDVTRLAKDSTIARLIEMVSKAQGQKARTQRFIEKAEQYYAIGVIIFTAIMILVPVLFFSEDFRTTFYRAMSVMVAASPCAVVISTPATVLSAIGNGAKSGVLFKGGAHVERAATIKVVAFDKTGTLTVGRPQVTDLIPLHEDLTAERLLQITASIEQKSEHPLAKAIVNAAADRNIEMIEVEKFQSTPGLGIQAELNGDKIYIGNQRYFRQQLGFEKNNFSHQVENLQQFGKTCVLVGTETTILGIIGIADVLKESTAQAIRDLKDCGIVKTVMLTGDNERTAAFICAQAGLDDYYANLLPGDKLSKIQKLEKKFGPIMMVGDGVNDAPALAASSLGVAMGGAGSDVALETADVVLMGEDLTKIPYFLALSAQTRKTLIQNLVFAFGVIAVLIAAVLGFQLPLPLSVVGHEGSTVIVSLNGLRLLGFQQKK